MNKQDWTYKKLGEVYDVRDGTHDSPSYISEGFPLVTSKNLRNGIIDMSNINYISEQDYRKINERSKVDVGDVLFAMIGTIGNPVLVTEEPNYAIKNMALFKVPKNQCGKFLFYFLSSKATLDKMKMDVRGGTQRFVSLNYLRNFCINLPKIEEQNRIVAELDLLSGIIEKKKEQLKAYDQLAQSIFYTMFGDPIDNPKGWEVKKLSDISSLITDGSHYSPKHDEYGDIPMLSVKDMRDTHFEYENCKWIGRIEYEKLVTNGCKPIKNDVLIAKDGSYFKYIFVLTNEREQAILSSIAILRPIIGIVNPHFVAKYLSTAEIYSKVEREYLTGTAIKRVILKGIRKLPIFLPPLSLQQEFAEKVEAIERQKALVQQSIEETQTMFDYTMDKYFG